MSQLDYKPKSCRNCGHPQHCGGSYWLEIKELHDDNEGPYVVEACKKCSCEDCTPKKDIEEDIKKDIPVSMLNGL